MAHSSVDIGNHKYNIVQNYILFKSNNERFLRALTFFLFPKIPPPIPNTSVRPWNLLREHRVL